MVALTKLVLLPSFLSKCTMIAKLKKKAKLILSSNDYYSPVNHL